MVNLSLEANWASSLPFGGASGKGRNRRIFQNSELSILRIFSFFCELEFSPYSSRIWQVMLMADHH
jgi:hypothetical protein